MGHVASMCRAPGGGAYGGNSNNYNDGGNKNSYSNDNNNKMSMFCGYINPSSPCSAYVCSEFCV